MKKIIDIYNHNFRVRRIVVTAGSIFASKGITSIVALISLPLTINYLGEERFGMMMTMVSLLAFMNFADLGLGFSLQNNIPKLESNRKLFNKTVSSTFFFLTIVSISISVIFSLSFQHIEWHRVFNVESQLAIEEASLSIIILFSCFVINIPLSIVQKIQGGLQEGYYNNMWSTLGSVVGLATLYYAIVNNYGVPIIILCIYGSNTVFLLLNFLNQFLNKRIFLFPKIRFIDRSIIYTLIKEGLYFTLIQILFLGFNASDSIIISHTINPATVSIYIIGLKIISLITLPVQAIMAPSLPALNDAFEKNDIHFVHNLFSNGLKGTLYSSFILMIIFYFSCNFIIRIWLGIEYVFDKDILLGFVIFILYVNFNTFFSYFMLSDPLYKKLSIIYPIAIFLTIVGKIVICSLWGLSGFLLITSIVMIITFFLPSYFIISNIVALSLNYK